MNNIYVNYGIGQTDDKLNDQIVLTRKLNHSELIFNQKISNDQSKQHRWFRKDADQDWMLSSKNECYVC